MFTACLLVCMAVSSIVAAGALPLTLRQSRRDDVEHELMDPVADFGEADATESFQGLQNGVKGLVDIVDAAKTSALQDLRSHRSEFQTTLLDQRSANKALEEQNVAIRDHLMDLQEQAESLRNRAVDFLIEDRTLTVELQEVQRNITIAREFVGQAMFASETGLYSSPELDILAELSQGDEEAAHQKELQDFAALPKVSTKIALLSFVRASVGNQSTLEELLSRLDTRLTDAAGMHNQSLATLTEEFRKLYRQGEEYHHSLILEQEDLNATVQSTAALRDRLNATVAHLSETKIVLNDRLNSVRVFGRSRLGAEADKQPGQASFLQAFRADPPMRYK